MQLGESVRIGLREIALHKLRSLLTMLGVIFGVAAVISTAAIGSGARDELNRQLAALGTNTIRIRALDLKGKELADADRASPFGLTLGDLKALRGVIPGLLGAAPLKTFDVQVQSAGTILPFDVVGTNEDFPMISGVSIDRGRFLNVLDVEQSGRVAVIGDAVRAAAFPLVEPVGRSVMIDGQSYTVVGVLTSKARAQGGTVIDVGNPDRAIYLPINSALRRLGTDDPRMDKLAEIALKIADESLLSESSSLARRLIERRHNNIIDFTVIVPEELIRQQQQTKNVLSSVLMFIAGISLLVGGIGIMNIMLATVTQRTKEIGIRRALGATRRDILFQFLVESLIVSLCGGLIGIGIGSALASGIGYYANWPTIIPIESIAISTSIAAGVGLLFGLYPSLKAAHLDPIEALRTE